MKNLPPPRNALMRHADYISGDTEKDTVLDSDSVTFLQEKTIPQLVQHVGKVEIAIIYSPLMRAVLATNVLRSVLIRQSYTVKTYEEHVLREQSTIEMAGHAYNNLRDLYEIPQDTFTIFITHDPIIERSLGRNINYCAVVGHNFEIPGHK